MESDDQRGRERGQHDDAVAEHEPVAAAIAFEQEGGQVGRGVLVYDYGGGTFDCAFVVREPGDDSFTLALEPDGDAERGGDDLDQLVAWAEGRGEEPPPEKRYWWNPAPSGLDHFGRIARHWGEVNRTLARHLAALDRDRVRTYRLEDLVVEEGLVRDLADLLGTLA